MCRFPGLLTILGVCVAVLVAIAIGITPASDEHAVSPQPTQVSRLEQPALSLFSTRLFPNASRDGSFALRGHGKLPSNVLDNGETPRVKQTPKRLALEVAMIGDGGEVGTPVLR
ncbi:MAG: hypothetical protein K8U57_26040 [Planctomycetes bacterium]|nr:hypothetical protein [Planctomycetota bacterium]